MIWDTDPVALQAGLFSVRWYGLFLSAGLIASYYHFRWLLQRDGQPHLVDPLVTWGLLGSLLGARLGHFVFYEPQQLVESPSILFDASAAGLASHGAILVGTLALWLGSRNKNHPGFVWIMARVAFTYVLFCIVIRVGNFFNSEILGTPSDLPWAVTFALVDDVPRHPVQLYEALAYAPCFWLLHLLYRRGASASLLLGVTLTVMSVLRLVIEQFKASQTPFDSSLYQQLGMTLGESLTWPLLAAGIGFILYSRQQPKNRQP